MSFVPNGGGNIFIGNGVTQGWVFTWGNGGWQGNTFFEPQPFNTGSAMSSAVGSATLNNNGTFSFSFSITNHGPNSTFYNIQASNN
jgi:hypothetical protein